MMTNFNELAESQIHDSHYLKSVTDLGDIRPIVANRDIHSTTGLKLINAGMQINSAVFERLLQHKLAPPLDQCLTTENAVTGQSLSAAAEKLMAKDKRLSSIQAVESEGWILSFVIEQIPLTPAIAFKLTVMRDTQEDLFEHSLYVTLVSIYVGMQQSFDKRELVDLATAALLHDIGILHVDPKLLGREHRMTESERRHLYVHSVTAWLILKAYPEYTPKVLEGVLHHHERLDGSGYPRGLKTGEISLFGQVIAVAEIIASRYTKEEIEYGWSRLETILKLNLRRYGWNLVRHLKIFYEEEQENLPPCSEGDRQAAREKMMRISAIFAAWDIAKPACNQKNPICAFLDERMSNLKMEVIDAGLNPYVHDENLLGIQEGSRACFDARILLDETLWQLHNVVQELRRRWTYVDAETENPDVRNIQVWLKEVSGLMGTKG